MDCAYETGVNVVSIAAAHELERGIETVGLHDGSRRASPTPPAPWSGG